MPVVSIRLDDALYRQLKKRAYGTNLSISAFLRPLIQDAAAPGGTYVYTANDELVGISIQILAILSAVAHEQAPSAFQRGLENARALLRERSLLESETGR